MFYLKINEKLVSHIDFVYNLRIIRGPNWPIFISYVVFGLLRIYERAVMQSQILLVYEIFHALLIGKV